MPPGFSGVGAPAPSTACAVGLSLCAFCVFPLLPVRAAGQQVLLKRLELQLNLASLPDAPGRATAFPLAQLANAEPARQSTPAATGARQGTGSLTGKVLDTTGAAVAGAHIQLFRREKLDERMTVAGPDGSFVFENLPADTYRITVEATGMGTYVSADLSVPADKAVALDEITLAVGAISADINVTATDEQIADEQVKEEEKQRVFGVFPNFYTSYIWDAAPLNTRQKFSLVRHSVTDPIEFVTVGIRAGIGQLRGSYRDYGDGPEGFAKRYGAAFGDSVIARTLGSGLYPALLHQDPRYFYQGSGSFSSRFAHSIVATVTARGDSGHVQPNFSYVLGSLSASAISLLYRPHEGNGVDLVFRNTGITLATHAASNLIREFVLRPFVGSVPKYENGKPKDPAGQNPRGAESPTPKV